MTKSTIPHGLHYTKDHEWVRIDGDLVIVGITHHAQHTIGEITYVDLPMLDKRVKKGDELAAVESAKAASDVYAPVSGVVQEVNPLLEDSPQTVNTAPYGDGWICKLRHVDASEVKILLTPQQYHDLLGQEQG